jgi:hypothetical protein
MQLQVLPARALRNGPAMDSVLAAQSLASDAPRYMNGADLSELEQFDDARQSGDRT